jgi:hypothetical protein
MPSVCIAYTAGDSAMMAWRAGKVPFEKSGAIEKPEPSPNARGKATPAQLAGQQARACCIAADTRTEVGERQRCAALAVPQRLLRDRRLLASGECRLQLRIGH